MAKTQKKRGTRYMADRVELWGIGALKPYRNNPRHHSETQIQALMASIEKCGFLVPIIVDRSDQGILAGHCRLEAAKRLGLTEVSVIPVEHLNEAEIRFFRITDNKIPELGEWDQEVLARELAELGAAGLDFEAVGFTISELESAAAEIGALLPEPTNRRKSPARRSRKKTPRMPKQPHPRDYGAGTAVRRDHIAWQLWSERKALKGSVLDFGCGKDRHDGVARFDAFHAPDPKSLHATYDTIVCSDVLQVQPSDHLILQLLILLNRLLKPRGTALISVPANIALGINYSKTKGYRQGKTVSEWTTLIGQHFETELVTSEGCFAWSCRPLREKAGRGQHPTPATAQST
jgi:hypothetical protein